MHLPRVKWSCFNRGGIHASEWISTTYIVFRSPSSWRSVVSSGLSVELCGGLCENALGLYAEGLQPKQYQRFAGANLSRRRDALNMRATSAWIFGVFLLALIAEPATARKCDAGNGIVRVRPRQVDTTFNGIRVRLDGWDSVRWVRIGTNLVGNRVKGAVGGIVLIKSNVPALDGTHSLGTKPPGEFVIRDSEYCEDAELTFTCRLDDNWDQVQLWCDVSAL